MTRPLSPQVALPLIAVALVLGYGCYRLSRIPTFNRFRPYILLALIGLWGLAIIEAVFAVAFALTPSWMALGLFLLALLGATNYPWMRNVMAGLAVAFEERLKIGDSIRVGDREGTVHEFGLRSIRIHGSDGSYHDVPNHELIDTPVSNLAHGDDSACEITFHLPENVTLDEARRAARMAAVTSPLAAPRRDAEVYVESRQGVDERTVLLIRGYVFDAAHRERYESDVTSRLMESLDVAEEGHFVDQTA